MRINLRLLYSEFIYVYILPKESLKKFINKHKKILNIQRRKYPSIQLKGVVPM